MTETIDETLLFQISGKGNRAKIEVDKDHNVGVALWKGDNEPIFLDATTNTLEPVLREYGII